MMPLSTRRLRGGKLEKTEVIKASGAIQIENNITLLQRRAWNLLLANAYDELPTQEKHRIGVTELTRGLAYSSRNGNRSGCENFRLVVTSLSAVPCRHGNTGGIIIRSMGADPTRSAGLYSGA